MNVLKRIYKVIKKKLALLFFINWTKTIYFNFKMLPFKTAKQLPIFFYGSVKFSELGGEIIIQAPIKMGMIGFGQPYEMNTRSRNISEIVLMGKLLFKGHVQFGKDYFIYVSENAYCEMGHMSSIGTLGKVICTNSIIFGNWARIGSESQVIDTNFHIMKNTDTGEVYPKTGKIKLGNYNYIGNRSSIMAKTETGDFCTIASNSLCNKDYRKLGTHILIGGIPSKLLKKAISRDWETEEDAMKKSLIFKW